MTGDGVDCVGDIGVPVVPVVAVVVSDLFSEGDLAGAGSVLVLVVAVGGRSEEHVGYGHGGRIGRTQGRCAGDARRPLNRWLGAIG